MLKKIGHVIDYLLDNVSYILVGTTGIAIIVMAFSATYGVIRRYIFNNPEPYSYEISCMLLLFSFVFAVAGLERHGRHITCDIMIVHLSAKAQNIISNIIGSIAGLFVCTILTWKGLESALFSLQLREVSSSSWSVILFPIKILIPIGYGLLCLVLLAKLYRGISFIKRGEKRYEG